MSLDQNLFTLNLVANTEEPTVVDLVDPAGTVHYRKRRVQGDAYTVEVQDPVTSSLLATATAPHAGSKHKTLQLYNPDAIIELKYTGTLSFKWGFRWEDHEFEWRREECYILRKPDPAVLVAVTKEPSGRLKTTSVQILDYNLNRFDIDDRKGLEILILTALLTFQDANEAYHAPRAEEAPGSSNAPSNPGRPLTTLLNLGPRREPYSAPAATQTLAPPTVPPRPPPRTGVDRIAELHMLRTLQGIGEANELEVGGEGAYEDYAQFAQRLLQDDAMLFITVCSASAVQVPKVLRVVEETKRLRHKSGVQEELYQYVTYDAALSKSKGPRRINLDDPDSKGKARARDDYTPPENLLVHLSKIDMPELRPRAEVKDLGPDPGRAAGLFGHSETARDKGKSKEDTKAQKDTEKERKKAPKKQNPPAPPEYNRSAGPAPMYRTSSHLPHQYQPSPSPSQLNNPGIYAAPPPFPSSQTPNMSCHSRPYGASSTSGPGTISSPWLRR